MAKETALIVGVGDGLSASLARLLSREGYGLVLAARNTGKISALAEETGAATIACDASKPADVDTLFAGTPAPLRVVIYNPSARQRGPISELDPEEARRSIEITAYGAFWSARRRRAPCWRRSRKTACAAPSCSPAPRPA